MKHLIKIIAKYIYNMTNNFTLQYPCRSDGGKIRDPGYRTASPAQL